MRIKVAAILLACSAASFAQNKPALRVVVEGEGLECGIKRGAIESSATRALTSHGIQISTDAKDPYLYVNVNAYRVMQGSTAVGCSTRLGVSVRAASDPEPQVRGFKSKSATYVVLCEAGRLLSGSQREVPAAVTRSLEEDIKHCLAQLSY
ncbi:MAG TPA: hypothetical protein VNP36_07540 [Burkholderiales bacterium]|nr:hypothetical protein [Burkholderiales bacterium]